jgi:phosphatidylserine/phosphatidylglycerophosphate/cardiolipin synthase-like enzyme
MMIIGDLTFTKVAEEHHAENLLVIHEKALAAKYRENWEAFLGVCTTLSL